MIRERFNRLLKRLENRPWTIFLGTLLLDVCYFLALEAADGLATHQGLKLFSQIGLWPFFLNSFLIFTGFSLLYALSNRWLFSAGLTLCGAGALMAINSCKFRILGGPLVPSDLYLIPQMIDMLPVVFSFAHWDMLVFLASLPAVAALLVYLFRVRRLGAALWQRALPLGGGLLLLGWLFTYAQYPVNLFCRLNPITEIEWDKTLNYQRNGLFVIFAIDAARLLRPVAQPKGYSPRALAEIVNKARAAAPAPAPPAAAEPVNVIVFLAESFCDVQALGVHPTADPTPFIHSLKKDGVLGSFIVPTYGGVTTRTEFEVLTGLAMAYLPEIVDPYTENLNFARHLPALPRTFANHHYNTAAIHAFTPLSECRQVYPLLGFGHYYSSNDFKECQLRGAFVSDDSLVSKIIEVGDAASAKGEPFFILADSMATHGAYDQDLVHVEPLDVVTTLSQSEHKMLKTYVNAVADLDKAFSRLVAHFKNQPKKTLIVIFGDHLPPLASNLSIYRHLGYYAGPNAEELDRRMHTTPVAAWANYPLPGTEIAHRSATLYSWILKAAGLPLDDYARFNDYLARQIAPAKNKITGAIDRDYRMVQYDLLFGRRYLLKAQAPPAAGK